MPGHVTGGCLSPGLVPHPGNDLHHGFRAAAAPCRDPGVPRPHRPAARGSFNWSAEAE